MARGGQDLASHCYSDQVLNQCAKPKVLTTNMCSLDAVEREALPGGSAPWWQRRVGWSSGDYDTALGPLSTRVGYAYSLVGVHVCMKHVMTS